MAERDVIELKVIPLTSLVVGTVTGFDVYLKARDDRRPVLFRGKDIPFTEEVRERLVDSKVSELFIDSSDEKAYARYVEEHLGDIVRDEKLPAEEKSGLIYMSVQNLLSEVMTSERSGEVIKRSKAAVESSVDFMLNEPNALRCLMEVASFDYYTYTHSVNVFVFSLSLAQRVGCGNREDLRSYGDGLLLHDIGKSRIDPAIVNCRGKLSPEQWAEMKKHTVYGHEILSEHGDMSEVALDVTLHHHEKLDGTGYPNGLRGEEIAVPVRICTISDIFDALTTRRSYKEALPSFPALKLMKDEMMENVDPELFKVFVNMIGNP